MNILIALLTLVTGPLQARALGADGRGVLAAILVPLGLAPIICSLGLGTFTTREVARGRSTRILIGSLTPVLVAAGLIAIALSFQIARLFPGPAQQFVTIGLLTLPLLLVGDLLTSIAMGLGRWRIYVAVRLIPPLTISVGVIGLFVADRLTVASAAILAITGSAVASVVPFFAVLRGSGRPVFDSSLTRSGMRFGVKAWLGGLGSVANTRLDQLLMTRLVASRELGLYAVAVSSAGFIVAPLVGSLMAASYPRFSASGAPQIGAILRATLVVVGVVSATLAVGAPFLVPLFFGADFADAVPMVWVLLAANIPLAGVNVLSTALTASGRPGFSAMAEMITLCVTLPSLLLLLPILGGLGAALVSLGTYLLSFGYMIFAIRRCRGGTIVDYLVPRGSDVRVLATELKGIVGRRARRRLSEADG